jgi:hypothetical protein
VVKSEQGDTWKLGTKTTCKSELHNFTVQCLCLQLDSQLVQEISCF